MMINPATVARTGHGVVSDIEKAGIAGKVTKGLGKGGKMAGKGLLGLGGMGMKHMAGAAMMPMMFMGATKGLGFALKGTALLAIIGILANPKTGTNIANNINKIGNAAGNYAQKQGRPADVPSPHNGNVKDSINASQQTSNNIEDLPTGSDSAKQQTINDTRDQAAKLIANNQPQAQNTKQNQQDASDDLQA